MTAHEWLSGRRKAGLTQVRAAALLGVSQPYLSQLENGSRVAPEALAEKGAQLFRLPTALPLPVPDKALAAASPDDLQRELAALGYPKFAHVPSAQSFNPAGVVLKAIVQDNLDTRLVEALPWVLSTYVDLNWQWLRDQAKLRDVQNRLGYVVHLARAVAKARGGDGTGAERTLAAWEREIQQSRLAGESTLCRESMPQAERAWLSSNRPEEARYWNLLTSLSPDQLSYA